MKDEWWSHVILKQNIHLMVDHVFFDGITLFTPIHNSIVLERIKLPSTRQLFLQFLTSVVLSGQYRAFRCLASRCDFALGFVYSARLSNDGDSASALPRYDLGISRVFLSR